MEITVRREQPRFPTVLAEQAATVTGHIREWMLSRPSDRFHGWRPQQKRRNL